MVLRLNPDHPLVWRTPSSLQFGVEEPVLEVDPVSPELEVVLGLATAGVSRPVLDALASARRIGPERVGEVVDELREVLGDPHPAHPLLGRRILLDGGGAPAVAVANLLEQLGAHVEPAPPAGTELRPAAPTPTAAAGGGVDLVVVLAHYATAPRRAAVWLRADVPHLLVEFGDRSIRVGPVVVPGHGPCAMCLELARVDRDAAWTAIATQAAGRIAPSADALGAATAAVLVARITLQQLEVPAHRSPWRRRAIRVRRPGFEALGCVVGGGVVVETLRGHPRCGCRSP
ncbi:hypothetical protein [Herbiconiux liukaitaii]|uniref:hypothetical protein n=1 Tax=Herbiconiux liukaitaii TaxID=3342799 RepID=UPI0035B7468F